MNYHTKTSKDMHNQLSADQLMQFRRPMSMVADKDNRQQGVKVLCTVVEH